MCLPSLPIIFTTKKPIARIHQDTESKNAPPILRTAVLDPQTSSVGNGDVTAVDGTSGKITGNLLPGTVAVPERH
jgi:phage gp45-like